jgi:hypothetical protein
MATIVTGTPERSDRHSTVLAPLGLMISMSVPPAIIIAGIIVEGWDGISWVGAAIWGAVATVAFTLFSMMGKAMGMTDMDLLDLLGSTVAEPHTASARAIGAVIHHTNGAILGIAGAYAAALIDVELDWLSGLAWGGALWVLALLMMSTIGAVHPAIRHRTQHDPGPAATNFGSMTPVGSLLGHAVWGVVLGALYNAWPLG